MKTVIDSCKCSHLSPDGPEAKRAHLCMLCNNSSQEGYYTQQMWEGNLLFLLVKWKDFGQWFPQHQSGAVHYRQAKVSIPKCVKQANTARLSVCRSLAPRCCRLCKYTNITTAL